MTLPTTPQKPAGVQPGGGTCAAIEMAWAGFRRACLRTFCAGYVQSMRAKRQGTCPDCPHDIIDARDLKYTRNVCGYSFRPEDDPYAWRGRLGFARHGFAELFLFSLAYFLLGGACVLGAIVWQFWVCWIPFVALTLGELEILWFFRDPDRSIPADADVLVSPADGTITNIEEVDEPEFGKALRISIFLSVFNVHVNRSPGDAEVTNVRYFPGAYLDARNPDSAVRNEQLWIDLIEPATKRPIRVKQISGAIARRIVCWLKPGDRIAKGERLGMIKLGSRTDILILTGHAREICVKVGDTVLGGTTVLLRCNLLAV